MMEPDDLRTIIEDLEYLRTTRNGQVSDAEVRRGSAVLRRLLVEDIYGQAWRDVGLPRQPTVIAVDINGLVDAAHRGDVVLALCSGLMMSGVSMAGVTIFKRHIPTSQPSPPLTPDGFPGEREFGLSEYLSSEAGIVGGRSATRRDVIKYFANVKGGVHLGQRQKKAEAKLVARMTKFEKRVSIIRRDGLLAEFIAIVQAVARSPDTHIFIARARPYLGRGS